MKNTFEESGDRDEARSKNDHDHMECNVRNFLTWR